MVKTRVINLLGVICILAEPNIKVSMKLLIYNEPLGFGGLASLVMLIMHIPLFSVVMFDY